ncbi:MAG: branched-chain amino acid ABC transporter permease [Ktedonobacteraceae bacterium]|nr:branched-chain amino acid ABC transporter permease [Ktedonobacteraceae bacterium]
MATRKTVQGSKTTAPAGGTMPESPETRETAEVQLSQEAGGPARGVRRWSSWLVALGGVLLLALVPALYDQIYGFSAGFELHRLTLIGLFVIAALAQNILTGYAAQPSLGNAAFFGVGAYMLAWMTNQFQQPYLVGLVVAVLVSALLGIVIGGPALRISGAHLAIATLGLVLVGGSLLDLWDKTAGRQSYDLTNLPLLLTDDHALYLVILATVVVLIFLIRLLLKSRIGRAWIAIRDDEAAAEAFGINVTRYKILAFVLSAALTGLAGALYATWATTAGALMSSADQTIAFLAMIVVGGLGSITGSVLGAIFVGFLPLLLGQLPNTVGVGPLQIQVSTLTSGIYGLLLLLALIFFPSGLNSLVERGRLLAGRLVQRGGQQ